MIVDSSVILAILFEEDDGAKFASILTSAPLVRCSVANYVEVGLRTARHKNPNYNQYLDDFLERMNVRLFPVTVTQAKLARTAFATFGKGIHPAALNYGDCFAYALAQDFNEPLLFKGDDFSKTDVIPALGM